MRMWCAMGLIDEIIYKDLLLLNDIRNVFAHSLHNVGFNRAHLKEDCDKLRLIHHTDIRPQPTNAKQKFLWTVLSIYHALTTSIRQQVADKQLRGPRPP